MKHKHVGGAGDDHLATRPLADHADAKRAIHVAALIKHRLFVSLAVRVGVFDHEDPVAFFPRLLLAAVVEHLAHPDAAPRIDVDVGRTREQWLSREEGGREVVGQLERVGRCLAGGCQAHAEKRCQTSPDTDAIHACQLLNWQSITERSEKYRSSWPRTQTSLVVLPGVPRLPPGAFMEAT